MKTFLTLTLVLGITPIALGQISLNVHEADEITPFDCNGQTMVGARLTLIINSDSNDCWCGGLFIKDMDRALGTLAGRDKDPNSRDWTGSHIEDAGDLAKVTAWRDSSIWGFDLYTCYPFHPFDNNSEGSSTVAGDWFIIDYYADEVGECNVGFYDYNISWDEPNYCITFRNVPTRDLYPDEAVDFRDFAIFSSQWNNKGCVNTNWCAGADLDRDGDVDHRDLGLFIDYWLWPASNNNSDEPDSPDEPNYPEDPNITYSIVDASGLGEITIDINSTITLYVDIASSIDNDVWAFDIEVNISDPSLGSIDNTEYPDGTAQILAEPNRLTFADYWGPGYEQEEGVRLFGATLDCAIADGHLASFVFTSESQGDVILELINRASFNTDSREVFPRLESIVIHQVDPYSQQMMGMGGETEEMLGTPETALPESPTEIDVDEIVNWLEELWIQEKEIRETCSKTEWNEFIYSVKNPY